MRASKCSGTIQDIGSNVITVDTVGLQKMLCCGRVSAVEIGTLAGARVNVGRRVFWSVEKVRKYIKEVAE